MFREKIEIIMPQIYQILFDRFFTFFLTTVQIIKLPNFAYFLFDVPKILIHFAIWMPELSFIIKRVFTRIIKFIYIVKLFTYWI